MDPKISDKIFQLLVIACALLVLAAVLIFQPHFGLMDDHTLLYQSLATVKKEGFWSGYLDFIRNDLMLGVIRLTYLPMVLFLYGPGGGENPLFLFVLNWGLVILVVGFAAWALSRALSLPFWTCFGCNFVFYYFHDLFMFPSLQEKILIPLGALLILFSSKAWNGGRYGRVAAILGTTLLGICTKTSFVIFFPAATVLLFWGWCVERRLKIWEFLVPLAGFCGSVFMLGVLALRGTYGAKYDLGQIATNLLSKPVFYFFLAIVPGLWLTIRSERRVEPEWLAPLLTFAGFLLVFLPWGIDAYIQTILIPFAAAGLAQAIAFFPRPLERVRGPFLVVLASLAVLIAGVRSYRNFGRLSDFGAMLDFLRKSGEASPIYAGCEEGSEAMTRYLRETGSSLKIERITKTSSFPDNYRVVGDGALCVLPSFPCKSERQFAGRFGSSFQVHKLECRNK